MRSSEASNGSGAQTRPSRTSCPAGSTGCSPGTATASSLSISPTAQRWGRLSAALGYQSADLLIAATALEHGLTVVTRNVRHFEPAAVAVFNPFGDEPATDSGGAG